MSLFWNQANKGNPDKMFDHHPLKETVWWSQLDDIHGGTSHIYDFLLQLMAS